MVLDGDRLLHVVLTDVLVHLLYSERLPVLGDKATKLVSVLVALPSQQEAADCRCSRSESIDCLSSLYHEE